MKIILSQKTRVARYTVPMPLGGNVTYTIEKNDDQTFSLISSRASDTHPRFSTSEEALNFLKEKINNIYKTDTEYYMELATKCKLFHKDFQKTGLNPFLN